MDQGSRVEALQQLLAFADDKEQLADRLKALNLLADTSSRLWGFSVRWAELFALVRKKKEWGRQVPEEDKQHRSLSKWLRKPADLDQLARSVAAAYEDGFYWGGKKHSKKAFGEQTSSPEGSNGASARTDHMSEVSKSDDASASSSTKRRRKKAKKDKTKKKIKKKGKHRAATSSE